MCGRFALIKRKKKKKGIHVLKNNERGRKEDMRKNDDVYIW